MIHLALIAFLIPLPFGRREPAQNRAGWSELVRAFQSRGVAVLNSHPRCREADLDGLYVRGHRELVVCERGDRSLTLRHEGWHLVQSLCLSGRPWLQPDQVEARLTMQDRRELAVLVSPERRWREAEARAMANLDIKTYLQELDRACPAVKPEGDEKDERGRSTSPAHSNTLVGAVHTQVCAIPLAERKATSVNTAGPAGLLKF